MENIGWRVSQLHNKQSIYNLRTWMISTLQKEQTIAGSMLILSLDRKILVLEITSGKHQYFLSL